MNNFQEQWVAALRSTQFKQGPGALKTREPDGSYLHCCLGVGCAVAGFAMEPEDGDSMIGDNRKPFGYRSHGDFHTSLPDLEARVKLGLTNQQAKLLTVLNDDQEWTFAEIADLIVLGVPNYGPAGECRAEHQGHTLAEKIQFGLADWKSGRDPRPLAVVVTELKELTA